MQFKALLTLLPLTMISTGVFAATSITCPVKLTCNGQKQCTPANENGQPISALQWQYKTITGNGANNMKILKLGEADLDGNQAVCQYTYTLQPGVGDSVLFQYHPNKPVTLKPAPASDWQASQYPGLYSCGAIGESTHWPSAQNCAIIVTPR